MNMRHVYRVVHAPQLKGVLLCEFLSEWNCTELEHSCQMWSSLIMVRTVRGSSWHAKKQGDIVVAVIALVAMHGTRSPGQ
jgi:hypothetical protein